MTRSPQVRDLPVPPHDWPTARLRRLWRSRYQLGPFAYWSVFACLPIVAVWGVLYVINGLLNGWRVSYDVTLAIASPFDRPIVSHPGPALVLSLASWLLIPSLIGAVAGYLVNRALDQQRRRTPQEIEQALRDQVEALKAVVAKDTLL
jgi:hypothetical protein